MSNYPEAPQAAAMPADNPLIEAGPYIASMVRAAIRAAAGNPLGRDWGTSVRVTLKGSGEGMEPADCTLAPMLRAPSEEAVRVDFLQDNPLRRDLTDLIVQIGRELEPFVIGAGNVRADYSPERLKVFLADEGADNGSLLVGQVKSPPQTATLAAPDREARARAG
jgi:hypothetical protein